MPKSTQILQPVRLGLAALALFVGAQAMADDPQSYLLLCRGGSNAFEMHSQMWGLSSLPGVDSNVRARQTVTFVDLKFRRSSRPAGSGLNRGECAWADRGIRADEPDTLSLWFRGVWVVVKGSFSDDSGSTGSKITATRSPQYEVRGADQPSTALTGLLNALQNGDNFQVHAYNDGEGKIVMTRFGP